MRLDSKKLIPYLIVIIPLMLVLSVSFLITSFYLEKVTGYFTTAKNRAIAEKIDAKKAKSEMWAKQLNLLFEYKYNRIDENIKLELQTRVNEAYESANFIYDKYKAKKTKKDIQERIVDSLSQIVFNDERNYIFITDYKGNSVLHVNKYISKKDLDKYQDADFRNIVLEEIQLIRKNSEGFLYSRVKDNINENIFVKDLGLYDWFIGSSINQSNKKVQLKKELLNMVQSIPVDKMEFMGLYDAKKPIYLSKYMQNVLENDSLDIINKSLSKNSQWHQEKIKGYYYFTAYFAPLDWYLVYGFDTSGMSKQELLKQKSYEALLDKELDFIVKMSALIMVFVTFLSLLLSRKINKIFKTYQQEVQQRTNELEDLNLSLEKKVQEELKAHRQKDKMLIQQSKMAEMGDMLSMIAHQWRQPLNQMSYLFMNVESAYEYNELTKEYLDEKLKEGNELLEFMSVTIDDFRNYFRPDKPQEFVLVSDVINSSLSLVQNSLDSESIEVEVSSEGRELAHIYKNEFMQVILNLIKNAKDILVQNKIQNPKITIKSTCHKEKLIVTICDNGGGVDEAIKERIFEPYFSTKDKKHGTGLGLYMSKMIIEEHLRGELRTENTQEGACFIITL